LAHTKAKCARKLTCYSCGKLFTRVQGLAIHLVEVRHGETVCSICGHEAESQHDTEIHIGKGQTKVDCLGKRPDLGKIILKVILDQIKFIAKKTI
jgi:hypothetical protein